ncbi:amino acid adenylation domain-containing protein [Massilia aurea]|uniref:non-ribosomal peptide synthetase n=1 Tax=Massilia aurea TaxID=373040 RepID=UPI002162B146|nr:amino acid adenylation domain-containing protein [Massilia aurea]MCS0709958.1 amino acid adenylation domain-containing protein [Massilia aurea]
MNLHPKDLLASLHAAGVTVTRDGNDLILHTENEVVPEHLIDAVCALKQALLGYLDTLVAPKSITAQRDRWLAPNRCPASPAQRQLWLAHRASDSPATYNLTTIFRVFGSFDIARFELAVDQVIERHEVLRTTFHECPDGLIQQIEPDLKIGVARALVNSVAHELQSRSYLNEWTSQEFDLNHGPLLRVGVVAEAPDQYVVSLVVHHIVFDAWSAHALLYEVLTTYAGIAAGRTDKGSVQPLQFADYAFWQQNLRDSGRTQEQRNFWSRTLSQAPAVTTLPYDFPITERPTSEGAAVNLAFTPELSAAVLKFATAHNTSLFNVTATALIALLAKYTSQEDLCIGVPVSNRNNAELQSLIGFLVNTAVLRLTFPPDATFIGLLEQCKHAMQDMYANSDLPFEDVLQKVKPDRSAIHSPLFQVMLSVLHTREVEMGSTGLRCELVDPHTGNVKYDLVLNLREHHGALTCRLEYRTQLYERSTAVRFLANFQHLLSQVVSAANCKLDQLSYVSPSELTLQHDTWNATQTPVPEECIHAQFERQAHAFPSAIAIVTDTRSYSYEELNTHANKLAFELLERLVKPGDRIMICMPRSVDLIALILAVVKVGGIFVPADPAEPTERLKQIFSNVKPSLFIVTDSIAHRINQAATTVAYEAFAHCAARHAKNNPSIKVSSGDSAYIMFTSGSTGTPKGALVKHRGLINRFRWQTRVHGYTKTDIFVQKSPITFDTAVWEIFIPLSIGARLVVADHDGHRDPEYLANLIAQHGITVIDFVPSMLAVFLNYCGVRGEMIRTLRHIILGGEPLPLRLLYELKRRSAARVYNQYGPTETSIGVTAWIGDANARQVSIGRPIDNTRIYILDVRQQPLPVGAVGELFIGGTPVGGGYFGRDDLTKKAFLSNPFLENDVLYRTGDIARYLPDGEIEYRGRVDSQVKIRGIRVELGEVARALLDHAAIREAFAKMTDGEGRSELSIYYVNSSPVTIAQLRQHLKQRLPRHMLPTHYVALEIFPLTRNGKVDEKALPIPVHTPSTVIRALRTPTQHALARIWHSLLSVLPSSLDDDFFELGGHSIIATQLILALREQLQSDLSLKDVFEFSTVESMSERIEQMRYLIETFEI